jgi:hypothetical protein
MTKKFRVRYIDQTTSKTVEKTITDIEQHDLYKLQREGKITIIDIHRVSEGSEGSEKEMSEEGKEVIDRIRGEIQKKVLETGRHWIPTVNNIPVGQLTTDELRVLLKEIKEKYPEAIDKFEALNLLDDKRYKFNELAAKVWEERAKPTVEEVKKIPEGVETVKYTFVNDKDAEVTETIFDAITTGKYEFRSAVNIGTMVRCVMYEKGERVGTPVRMIVTDKDMAWHLQQLIDWCLRRQAKILATRREGKVVEVAFRMEGIKPMPKEEKEKLWYHFKKTDGWTLVGNEK